MPSRRPARAPVGPAAVVVVVLALSGAIGGASALSTGGPPRTATSAASPPTYESDITTSASSTLVAASVAASLLLASTTSPALAVDGSQLPSAGNPRAVRVEFRPGDDSKLPLTAPGAFAKALYADRLEFFDAVREVRAAVDEVRTTLTPALEDLAGPGSTVKLSPPRDVRGAIREAFAGEGTVVVNGEAVGLSVRSEEGALDVRVTSRLLPRIPFRAEGSVSTSASRRAALPTETPGAAPVITADAVVEEGDDDGETTPNLWDELVSFLGSPFALYEDLTNLQAGEIATVPGIATVYGISYQYYRSEVEREEKEAAEKKSMLAAKKKKNAIAAKSTKDGKKKKEVKSAEKEPVKSAEKEPVKSAEEEPVKSAEKEPASTPAPESSPPAPVEVGQGPIALKKGDEIVALYDAAGSKDESSSAQEGGVDDGGDQEKSKRFFAVKMLKKMVMPWKSFERL